MRKFLLCFLALLFLFVSGCSKYSESDFIGKPPLKFKSNTVHLTYPAHPLSVLTALIRATVTDILQKNPRSVFWEPHQQNIILLFLTKTALQ